MPNVTTLRSRYAQIFVILLLFAQIFVLVQSCQSGMANFEEGFFGKHFLIENANWVRIKIGDRVFPQVLIGKDGWMEFTSDGNLDDFQNVAPLDKKQNLVNRLRTLYEYLQSKHITLLVVITPNKASIYPDKLPEQIKPLSPRSKLMELTVSLKRDNLPVMLDLGPALRNARQTKDVFYKTNTHWNGYGAYVAYKTIINSLGSSHPELKPYTIGDLVPVKLEPTTQDIPILIQADFIIESSVVYVPKEAFVQSIVLQYLKGYNKISWIPGSKLPTLLMFHDSFGNVFLNGYLSMNFGKSYFIHVTSASDFLKKEDIELFNPDIVIIQISERNIENLVGDLSNFASK